MSLIAKASSGNRQPAIEAGSYAAKCYAVVDMGEHYSAMYGKYSRKVLIMWELPYETAVFDGEEKPRAISEIYTNSISEKSNLRKTLENWRGRAFTAEELEGFDLRNVLGTGCMLSIIHMQKKNEPGEYAKIGSVSKLPKNMPVPQDTYNPQIYLDLDEPGDLEKMKDLPEWVRKRIEESETYKQLIQLDASMTLSGTDDFTEIEATEDLPF